MPSQGSLHFLGSGSPNAGRDHAGDAFFKDPNPPTFGRIRRHDSEFPRRASRPIRRARAGSSRAKHVSHPKRHLSPSDFRQSPAKEAGVSFKDSHSRLLNVKGGIYQADLKSTSFLSSRLSAHRMGAGSSASEVARSAIGTIFRLPSAVNSFSHSALLPNSLPSACDSYSIFHRDAPAARCAFVACV